MLNKSMLRLFTLKTFCLAALMVIGAALPASAQLFGGGREAAGDTAELLLRIDRLENQIRTMNGRMEEMQFQVRRSEEMLRKFQQDVDFRFQEMQPKGGARPAAQPAPAPAPAPVPPQRRGDLEPELGNPAPSVAQAAPSIIPAPAIVAGTAGSRGNGRGDAFDPSADPNAPGAPRPLGSPESASRPVARSVPGGPLGPQDDANAPMDLTGGRQAAIAAPPAQAGAGAMPATTPKDEFELAVFSLERGQYEAAEAGLVSFLQRYPKDPLAGEAVYYLGESFSKRNRHRDAAEQYLKISTDYPKTAHAPDAMLRLGQSLEKLGAKEQACAFFAEVPRKYPQANAIKTSAQREFARAKCS